MCAIICKIHTIYHTYYANYTTTVCSVHISAYLQYIHESQEQEMFPKTGSAPFVSASRVVYKKSGDTLASEILYTTIFTVRIEQEGV